jgi:glycosyltransferase involved in cell wall biosynthesis
VAAADRLNVMYVSGAYLGFAGSARRYRQYFRRMPRWRIDPLVVTVWPRQYKNIDATGELDSTAAPARHGLVWRHSIEGVPTAAIKTSPESRRLRRGMLFLLAYWLLLTRRDIHVVHVLQQAKKKTFPYALLLRAFPTPKVLSITKDFELRPRSLGRWAQRTQYGCYNAILCQSEKQKLLLSELHVRPGVTVVPNGVDTARLTPLPTPADKRALRESIGLPAESLLFLYVGSVQPRKGTDILLEAWRDVIGSRVDMRLLIVGPRFDQTNLQWSTFAGRIQELMRAPGMSASVTFVGYRRDVLEYLQAADAFVLPSDREGVPNAVLEAMACGLPCVLTPFFGSSNQLGVAGEHFVLSERTPHALADAMRTLVGWSPERRAALGAKARQLMLATMSMDHAVDVHCQLYRRLLEQSRPPSHAPSART